MSYDYRQIISIVAPRGRHPVNIIGDGVATDVLTESPALAQMMDSAWLPGDGHGLLVVANLLECLDKDDIAATLEKLKAVGRPIAFVISTVFSPYLDSNGRNLVRTIESREWWRRELTSVFPTMEELPAVEYHSGIFLTFSPPPVARLKLVIAHRIDHWKKSLGRRRAMKEPPASGIAEVELFGALAGRSIAIVGNAHRLSSCAFGEEIDGHDIVIRLNRSPIIASASHGLRTDWIATSVDIPQELMAIRGADHVLWMSPGYKRLPDWLRKWPKTYFISQKDRSDMTRRLGARPSTGFSVIDLIGRSPAAKVTLYGFDFFTSPSFSGHRMRQSSPHDFSAERLAVLDLIQTDDRFTLR